MFASVALKNYFHQKPSTKLAMADFEKGDLKPATINFVLQIWKGKNAVWSSSVFAMYAVRCLTVSMPKN